jgi:iron complex outermembrane recepter protein
MKKFFFFALLVALAPLLAIAQYSIKGKVVNSSKKELIGASISLDNTSISTQTDQSGQYIMSHLKPGNYTVRVSFLGFQTAEKTISLNSDQELNFILHPGSIVADEIIVRATRASENAPTTYRNLSRQDIEKNNLGQDLPYLLNQTPSVTVTSDAGAGVGYTGIRIRGSDPSRINVTINGIPYNDSESQGSFWVNMPDFASSVDNIQIQRGVGTSTNGAGAFGASINVQTNVRRDTAYAEINNTYGSFETWKNTINVGTGLLDGKFSIDGRLSRIKSDGYIDNAFSNLKGYFVSGAYYGKKSLLRANVFAGDERTYQAWNGVPEYLLETNRRYNYYTYSDQTDNYKQNHYQLLYSNQLSDKLSLNGALHYTRGRGYYKEFKEDEGLGDYSLPPIVVNGSTLDAADLIRKRWLDNDFYGLTYSLNYKPTTALDLTLGGAYNEYTGRHFGEVVWTEFTHDME